MSVSEGQARFYCYTCRRFLNMSCDVAACEFCDRGFVEMVSPDTGVSDLDIAENQNWIAPQEEPFQNIGGASGSGLVALIEALYRMRSERHLTSEFRINPQNIVDTSSFDFFTQRPLAKEKILAIPIYSITKVDVDRGEQCSICLEKFTLLEKLKKLPCKHLYHVHCITSWLQVRDSCPICRGRVKIKKKKNKVLKVARTEMENGRTQSLHGNSSFCLNCNQSTHGYGNCPFEPVCYNCRRSGHIARDCPNMSTSRRPRDSLWEGEMFSRRDTEEAAETSNLDHESSAVNIGEYSGSNGPSARSNNDLNRPSTRPSGPTNTSSLPIIRANNNRTSNLAGSVFRSVHFSDEINSTSSSDSTSGSDHAAEFHRRRLTLRSNNSNGANSSSLNTAVRSPNPVTSYSNVRVANSIAAGGDRRKCFHCDQIGHIRPNCPNRVQCYSCGRRGHISRFCRIFN